MSYRGIGALTASFSASASAGGRGSSGGGSRSPAPETPACVTSKVKKAADITCKIVRYRCDLASAPLCPALATPIAPPPKHAIPAPPAAATEPTGKPVFVANAPAATGYGKKVPVPVAAPVPIAPPESAPPAGVPAWMWIAGGIAVLGTGAYLYKRKKAA